MSLFHHLFVPHHTNNQKAKILHSPSLAIIIGVFALFQIVIGHLTARFPLILGYASQIAPAEIVRLTNIERQKQGLPALTLNSQLSSAALKKASDMFAKNYWAHVSPSGTQPWFFISQSGYTYRYAGENLARDFSDPQSVVTAWMNSPTHKENVVNSRYQDIGVAVIDGTLEGRETTLVVQMFGTKLEALAKSTRQTASIAVKAQEPQATPIPTPVPTIAVAAYPEVGAVAMAEPVSKSLVRSSPYEITKFVSYGLLIVIMAVLAVDIVVASRRRLVRWTSKSFAHLLFMLALLIAAFIISKGQIL